MDAKIIEQCRIDKRIPAALANLMVARLPVPMQFKASLHDLGKK